MSADAWRFCPKCTKDDVDKRKARKQELVDSYGKVSMKEYEKLKKKYNDKIEASETLREDYWLYTNEDGVFEVSYGCSCDVCGFSFQFNHKEKVI